MALVKQPSIRNLDEPTVNIDPEGDRELLALVGPVLKPTSRAVTVDPVVACSSSRVEAGVGPKSGSSMKGRLGALRHR
jgi:ABC-type cobalamin/Fe3+-siderophores transport system ATPase subunit